MVVVFFEHLDKLWVSHNVHAGSPISESTSIKIISGLTETIDLVLDFLQDAKVIFQCFKIEIWELSNSYVKMEATFHLMI